MVPSRGAPAARLLLPRIFLGTAMGLYLIICFCNVLNSRFFPTPLGQHYSQPPPLDRTTSLRSQAELPDGLGSRTRRAPVKAEPSPTKLGPTSPTSQTVSYCVNVTGPPSCTGARLAALPCWGDFSGAWPRDAVGERAAALQTSVVFVKVHKAASGTIAGIFRRIGEREGLYGSRSADICLQPEVSLPVLCADHQSRVKLIPDLARHGVNATNALFFTSLREPASRWLSSFYWFEHAYCLLNEAKRPQKDRGHCDSTPTLLKYFRTTANFSFQFHYVHPDKAKSAATAPGPKQKTVLWRDNWRTDLQPWRIDQSLGTDEEVKAMLKRDVLSHYAFVFVTSRVAESAVVLKHKLDLPSLSDVLFHSTKLQGDRVHAKRRVEDLPKAVREYIHSDEYQASQRYDRLLLEVAEEALDCEIQRLGAVFQRDLRRFKLLMEEVAKCPKPMAEQGSACVFGDCGSKCLNRVGNLYPKW